MLQKNTSRQSHTKSKVQGKFFQGKPSIQKKEKSSSNLIGKAIADQLADKKFKKHIDSLLKALQKKALESTDTTRPENAGEQLNSSLRLTALNMQLVFEDTARNIIADPDLKEFRKKLGKHFKRNAISSLAVALAYVLLSPKIPDFKQKLGAGFSVGGSADFGSIGDLKLEKGTVYIQFASKFLSIKAKGNAKRDSESGDLVAGAKTELKVGSKTASGTTAIEVNSQGAIAGSAKGEFKIGGRTSAIQSAFAIDPEGKLVLSGKLSQDLLGQKGKQLTLTSGIKFPVGGSELLLDSGVSGKFKLQGKRALRIGSDVQVSTETGLKKLEGFVEYQHNGRMRLRLEGNLNNIVNNRSIAPGQEVKFQATLGLTF